MRRKVMHVTRRVMNMNVEGRRERDIRKINCVKMDWREMDVRYEMTTDTREWKKRLTEKRKEEDGE
jgi:hypothetical protein